MIASLSKTQCWQFMNCSHGSNKTCPAVIQYAGRACWLVDKTHCTKGEYLERIHSCRECAFYVQVKAGMI